MAFRTRRRKPRVVWLPILGDRRNSVASIENTAIGVDSSFALNGGANSGTILVDAVPITFDDPESPAAQQLAGTQTHSLMDFVSGSGYRLRRIVGKCFVGVSRASGASQPTDVWTVDAAAGFIIARTDSVGNITTDFQLVNPLVQDSADDPWIWRRRWFLGTGTSGLTATNDTIWSSRFPPTNSGYGSVSDGPHIDQKTARVISTEERLVFVFAVRGFLAAGNVAQPPEVGYYLDARLLASMRTNMGNRRNASR